MRQNFIDISVRAQSLGLVLAEELLRDVHELVGILNSVLLFVGVDDLGLSDFKKEQLSFLVVERRDSDEHFVD